jgi:feruloyl esterase
MMFALLAALVAPSAAAGSKCEDLARLSLPNTTIVSTRATPAGSFQPARGPGIEGVPATCRVAGTIKPSADSDIQFEVWMPVTGWNGKFQGVGNGGFAGSIDYGALARFVSDGYAAGATDTGHRADGTDARWARGHSEKVIDFGHRAIHEMTDKSKAVARAFYGRAVERSYFHSCSNGGRQALMEAQRYPEDYDGIVAGAPANFWTHLLTKAAYDMQTTVADAAAYIPASKLPALEAAVLAACDARDGVSDRIVDSPAECAFDPGTLACTAAESDSCLTPAQMGALAKLYAGPRTADRTLVHRGFSPGAETGPGGWALWITGSEPGNSLLAAFATGFFRDMLLEQPEWDVRTFELGRDLARADAKLAPVLNATDPDLDRFRRRGGKLILYHGWADAGIAPLNAIDYYESVRARMGTEATDGFARLFMMPGVQHCAGGPGPSTFYGPSALAHDAEHDVEKAIERWVEKGVAPDRIVAASYKADDKPSTGLARTRPLCPYPQVARWTGAGSSDDAANFVCRLPDRRTP